MKKTRDERYYYRGGAGGRAWCHLQVYRGGAGELLAICTELADNPGMSVTNAAEQIAHAVWEQEGRPAAFVWIEHYPPAGRGDMLESWSAVRFRQGHDGHFADPQWQPVTQDEVEAAITQAEPQDLPAAWHALIAPLLQIDCARCGRPLTASDLLAGARLCSTCQESTSAVARPRNDDPELAAARAAWQQRYNAHEVRLDLSPEQRARLLQALAGPRSLWSFSAAELQDLVARLEGFQTADEVQAFLDGTGDDPPGYFT